MESNNDKKLELNPDSLKILKNRIYLMERENHKTKKYKDNEMVERIRKLIEAEVDKNDN
ncbi:hypothetical protein EDC14_105414 [Hydrogenispora ethanolica]|uniref:Uncharacterized protein n=1 Tax=Hydrogenispora ethanolica TaxID=1082276 RepID=A0A4R1QRT0_HYDET|nr:hypothetical protein [Hydrogenispora ethanolica]TCL55731.1 hypothetical protein EDC14_105414 [Hydrogenispora ethanolica]